MREFLYISFGAILGANARFLFGNWILSRFNSMPPVGTLMVNLSGSFLLGLLAGAGITRLGGDPRLRLLLAVGFLGSYTTFSTYTLESLDLFQRGQWHTGFGLLFGSALLGCIAVLAGVYLGRLITSR